MAYYVFDHLYCLINVYLSYFIYYVFSEQTAVQLFFVYVELVSCSLVREPVLNTRWPPAVHYYVCCLRFRAMCFYSSLDLTMSIGKDLFELITFIK